jgi:plastocyanin
MLTVLLLYSCTLTPENPKVYTVEIKDMKFVPDDITVNSGDTIIWINRDMVAHDVTEEDTKAWTSSIIIPEQSWKMAITSSANYYCSIHVVMKGKIRVE